MKKGKNFQKNIIIYCLFIVLFFGIFLWYGIAPRGRISYASDFNNNNNSFFISKLSPSDRLGSVDNNGIELKANPIYFTLHTLRRFDKAKLIFEYENKNQAIIEAGVLVDNRVWRYALKPIENKMIDEISKDWFYISNGETIFLQKQKRFNSIEGFLGTQIQADKLAVYNYNWRDEFILPDYSSTPSERAILIPLRGNFQFYTYVKQETLDFKFKFDDLNKNKDTDPIDVNLYYQDNLIDSRHLEDANNQSDSGNIENRGELKIKQAGLPEGAYKIEVKVNDDVITKSIITTQSKLAFLNKLWISDSQLENVEIYTNSHEISAQTVNPGSLQDISIGSIKLQIGETYKQYSVQTRDDFNKIKIKKADVIVAGDGLFSFSEDEYFNPNPVKINQLFNPDKVEYILANYQSPMFNGDIKMTTLEFDLSKAYYELEKSVIPGLNKMTRKYSFLISIPDLKIDEDNDRVILKKIKIDLEGKNLLELLR